MSKKYLYEGKMVSEDHLLRCMYEVENLSRVRALIKLVPKNKRVLDLGCGFGVISRLLSNKSESVEGIDLLPSNINLCNEWNKFDNTKYVCGDVSWLIKDSNKKFQVIVLTEVIEHVKNPYKLIQDCYTLLEEGGYLIVSTPNATGVMNNVLNFIRGVSGIEKEERGFGTEKDHIYLFDQRVLLRLLNECGFVYVNHKFKGSSIIMKVAKK